MKTSRSTLTAPASVPPATAPPSPELPVGECAALIGLDWGDKKHAIAIRVPASAATEALDLEHSAEALHQFLEKLRERFGGQRVAVALEASKGAVVAALLEHEWLLIYPVHPATSRRFSVAFTPSGAKHDRPDALTLLEILCHHRDKLRLLVPHDAATRRLGLLVEARRGLINQRTQLSNRLTSLLKNYYPQALTLTGQKRAAPLAIEFLARWPELSELQRARPQTLRAFFYAHGVRREEVIQERLKLIGDARPLTSERALCEVSILQLRALLEELRVLQKHIAAISQTIAVEFDAHPEAAFFASLPGAGAAMAPRLSVLFGSNRARWTSPQQLQTYCGIAPVIEASGRQHWVHWRWNAPVFARQTLVEWAGLSVRASTWARAYYEQQKARGKTHSMILRSLAFKWLRILWRCWQDRKPYDEDRYLKCLQHRHPALYSNLQPA